MSYSEWLIACNTDFVIHYRTTENFFIRFAVANSNALIIVSSIIGWLYFVAWSVSFYPQTILNYTRKSVVGLNLDFTILNFVGHSLYLIYNASMYWSTYIEEEYLKRYSFGLNPVKLNDVFFSIHATILTIVTLAQCFYYEVGAHIQYLKIIVNNTTSVIFSARESENFPHNQNSDWVIWSFFVSHILFSKRFTSYTALDRLFKRVQYDQTDNNTHQICTSGKI